MARRSTARPSTSCKDDLPVVEHRLDNGLKVLLLPRKVSPVVVCDLYYPVGSYDEPAGKSGIAHFVEHMLFKGTERWPKGQIDQLTYISAGQANAETGEDLTHYWFGFPADRWESALLIEADRMQGALFDPREVEAERFVIAEERARDLESPLRRLDYGHLTTSYVRHPYRNPILGWPDDFASITVDDLRAFHAAHYRPDGAVLVVVGQIKAAPTLRAIEAAFGKIPPGNVGVPKVEIVEPRQQGRRDLILNEPESVARGLFGWHTVPIGHPDRAALEVLSDLLTSGRRARLWDRLVEKQRVATWVDTGQESARRAGQFLLQIEAAPGMNRDRIEAEIHRVIEDLAESGPTPEELARSRHRLEAAWRWEQEDLGGLASGLGEVALWDDWREWSAHRRASLAVDVDDIRRVATIYLTEPNLTVGWSVPTAPPAVTVLLPTEIARGEPRPSAPKASDTIPNLIPPQPQTRLEVEFKPVREVLPNGLRLLSERRPGTRVVALEVFVDAGQLREHKPGLAYLTGRMLEEGTASRSSDQIAQEVEDAGASLDVGSTGLSLRIKSEDLAEGIELLADLAMRPSFPVDSVQWLRRKIAAEWHSDRDDPGFRAESLFHALVYGTHPYGRDPRGSAREMAKLDRADVEAHHRAYFTSENAYVVAVGDFEPRRLRRLVEKSFGSWRSGGLEPPPVPALERAKRPRVKRVSHPGEQVHLLLGHLGITRRNPDYDALQVVDLILGEGTGFTDRLSRVLRDELGLAYSVGGGITDSADLEPGLFEISLGTSPEEADRAVRVAIEQIDAIHRGDFTDDEIDRAKAYLSGAWLFEFQTIEQRAGRLLEAERWGLPPDDPIHLPERLARLTPHEIRRAAKRWIAPESLARVEYGPILPRGQRASAECA